MNTQRVEGHTELPWEVRDGTDRGFGIWISAPKAMVANNRGPDYPRQILEDEDYPEKQADAAFIVHACNNIERLEKVNEALVRLAERCAGLNEHNPEIGAGMLMTIVTEARAALALAKEPA